MIGVLALIRKRILVVNDRVEITCSGFFRGHLLGNLSSCPLRFCLDIFRCFRLFFNRLSEGLFRVLLS